MKLQLSCDLPSLEDVFELLEQTAQYVDIIELGTPLVFNAGLRNLAVVKGRFPDKTVLADLKIMDGGYQNAELAFAAGADIVTALALASAGTLQQVLQCARDHGRKVMVDMLGTEEIPNRLDLLASLRPHYICVHTSVDQRSQEDLVATLRAVRESAPEAEVAVAGGINLDNLAALLQEGPDIVVVGRAVADAPPPEAAARRFRERLDHSRD